MKPETRNLFTFLSDRGVQEFIIDGMAYLSAFELEQEILSAYKVKVKVIGSGAARVVFKVGNEVIKFNYSLFGDEMMQKNKISQNQVEYENWLKVKGLTISKYFVPVIDVSDDYKLLVMPYISSKHKESDNEFEKVLIDEGITYMDLNNLNMGTYNGNTVLLDYGTGLYFHKKVA